MLRFADSEYRRSRARQAVDDQRAEATFVASVMTRDVQTVRPDTPLAVAAQMLVRNKFGCLPVTNHDGALLGIGTEHDFLRVCAEQLAKAR